MPMRFTFRRQPAQPAHANRQRADPLLFVFPFLADDKAETGSVYRDRLSHVGIDLFRRTASLPSFHGIAPELAYWIGSNTSLLTTPSS